MSVQPNPRLPARLPDRIDEDELALDRQSEQPWRDPHPVSERVRPDDKPVVVRRGQRGQMAAPAVDFASRGIGLLLKLTLLLMLLAVLWGMVSFMGTMLRTPGAIGDQVTGALQRGAGAVGAAGQHVADTFDPAHPPRDALVQDVEIDELLRLDVGAKLAGSSTRELTVASIQRRADPSGPDGAVYAVIHGELREPQETKVLGMTVRSTRDPKDYYLYKGETIRIGRKLYRVNWVSVERQQLALVVYRDQDRVSAALKAEID
jgi:hypothetical protein